MKIGKTGPVLNSDEIINLLEHVLCQPSGQHTPVCIWGTHGIGKSQLVAEFAKTKGWNFAYASPGEWEEMGDLHGLPVVADRNSEGDKKVTRFIPPEWVPVNEGDGILLLDDINRAEERILRGLMSLFQNRGMFSWKLPAGWRIVCTANPDNGQYAVSTMDDALMTRILHCELEACAKAWAKWASKNGVDPRGIDFVLTYPEIIQGQRTTPRTLVEFFRQISPIKDLNDSIALVDNLAAGLLDEATVGAFSSYIRNDLKKLLMPQAILEASPGVDLEITFLDSVKDKEGMVKLDRISTIFERILNYLAKKNYHFKVQHRENFAKLFQMDFIPEDLKARIGLEVGKLSTEARKILKHSVISEALLATLK